MMVALEEYQCASEVFEFVVGTACGHILRAVITGVTCG